MLVPILCFTCGYPIGDLEVFYHAERAKKIRSIMKERGTVAAFVTADGNLQIDCKDILDRLHINSDCCRKLMMTSMIFTDYYNN